MPTTILLIRHPESAWNRRGVYQGQRDTPLSPLGRIQAELVAARLSGEPIAGIVTSPLRRASSLAHAIARYHHLEPRSDQRLTEICHGQWEGLSRHDVRERFPKLFQQWEEAPHTVSFPGGESLQDVHDRSLAVITDLLEGSEDATWVVVTHDTVCRLVVAVARSQPVVGFADVALENAGITTLVGPQLHDCVRDLNDVTHLGEHRVNLSTQAL